MSISGIIGSAFYSGCIQKYSPLLRFAQQFNIGKLCVMGLGKVNIY